MEELGEVDVKADREGDAAEVQVHRHYPVRRRVDLGLARARAEGVRRAEHRKDLGIAADLGCGRTAASEKEVPNMLVNLV